MSDTFIIEVSSKAAGIVVRNPDGYRFFAASHDSTGSKASCFATPARPSAPPIASPGGEYYAGRVSGIVHSKLRRVNF